MEPSEHPVLLAPKRLVDLGRETNHGRRGRGRINLQRRLTHICPRVEGVTEFTVRDGPLN